MTPADPPTPPPQPFDFDPNAPCWKFTYPGGQGYTGSYAYAEFIISDILPRVPTSITNDSSSRNWTFENCYSITKEDCATLDGGVVKWIPTYEGEEIAASIVESARERGRDVVDVRWVMDEGVNWVTRGCV